jgi:putative PIN family toxin of toxin-antitoxin system
MEPLRLVFDTNIYVMASGMPGGYIDYWLDLALPPANKFQLYTSSAILNEVQEKLEQKMRFERIQTVEYIDRLKQLATQVSPKRKLDVVKEDPDDNIILECALEAHADIIVSADRDLLSLLRLKQFEGIQIHHPSNLKYIFSYLAGDD